MDHPPYAEVDCFASAEFVKAARVQVDKDIRALEEQIRCLKSRRNSIGVVFRLPPELLAYIFKFCRLPDAPTKPWLWNARRYDPDCDIRWTSVSHVCSHWRTVALACPSLWSHIPIYNSKWRVEMLARSGNAALRIIADSYLSPKLVEHVQSTMALLPRTKELRLTLSRGQAEKLTTICAERAAPLLQTFYFSVSFSRRTQACLPPNMFQGKETPRLRHVELHNCSIGWDSLLLSGLTHLVLRNIPEEQRATISQLIAVLARMPNLVDLELSSVFEVTDGNVVTAASASSDTDNQITLSHLKSIVLYASLAAITALLTRLEYPIGLTTSLTCTASTQPALHAFFPHISSLTASISSIQTLSIGRLFGRITSVKGWHQHYESAQDNPPAFQFNLGGAPSFASQDICAHLPRAYIRHLTLSDEPVTAEIWRQFFGDSRTLETVRLESKNPLDFVRCLSEEVSVAVTPPPVLMPVMAPELMVFKEANGSHETEVSPPSTAQDEVRVRQRRAPALYFPTLTALHLCNTHFSKQGEENDAMPFSALVDMLTTRCGYGVPVEQLHLYDCTGSRIEPTDMELLRRIVIDVYCVTPLSDSDSDE